jgi:hypothetical protein
MDCHATLAKTARTVITKEYNDCGDLYLVDDIELDFMVKPWEAPEEYVFLEVEGSHHPEPFRAPGSSE